MNLSFIVDDSVLDCIIFDSTVDSPLYQLETPKRSGGVLTTTALRLDGFHQPAFKIFWAGTSLEHTTLELNFAVNTRCRARDLLPVARGGSTYGSITINDVLYKWKSKGTGSKLVLVNNDTKAVVVESHRRVSGNGRFTRAKTPRCMNLDIAEEVADYSELILLTFLLVWNERVSERAKCPPAERFATPDLTSVILMGSY